MYSTEGAWTSPWSYEYVASVDVGSCIVGLWSGTIIRIKRGGASKW